MPTAQLYNSKCGHAGDRDPYDHAQKGSRTQETLPGSLKGAQAAIPWQTMADLSLVAARTCGAAACCWRIQRSAAAVRATCASGRAVERALHAADMMSPSA